MADPVVDPSGLGDALGRVGQGLWAQPAAAAGAWQRWGAAMVEAAAAAAARSFGSRPPGPVAVDARDRRYRGDAWDQNPWFFFLRQAHELASRLALELVDASGVDAATARKARFAAARGWEAVAPSNFLATNPTALVRAFETGGASLWRGARNFVVDLATNGGRPRQYDAGAFVVGRDLACTPGAVIFRNDLIEVIQYGAQTAEVHEIPLVLSPPWINKYYVMDLAPGRSFAEWAVQHGHTVFAISYRNPGDGSDLTFADYLDQGLLAALDVAQEVARSDQVNVAALCLGGTLTGCALATLSARGDHRVRSATLTNTMLDFSEPGELGCLVDAESLGHLEARMARTGRLEASDMASAFDALRANDLVWSYVTSNWLMGEDPPAFDILTWNADSTAMPARMHSFYLRSFYVENRLATGSLDLGDGPLELAKVDTDVYVLAAREDHIAPWRTQYRTTQLLGGDVRFVLSSAGHVAGIVNPPGPRAVHWVGERLAPTADGWLAAAQSRPGTWWEDWAVWIADRAGPLVEARDLGSPRHTVVCEAPGTYVLG